MKRVTLGHRLQYGIYRTFEAILRFLPVSFTFDLGIFISRLAFPLSGPLKRTVLRNLRFAFDDEKSPSELNTLLKEVFGKTTGNLLTSIRLPFLPEEKIRDAVTITNLEILKEAIAKNNGTILLIPHMGNWELLAQSPSLAEVHVPFATHYRPLNNPLLNKLIERRRQQRGVQLFPKRTSSHTLCAFLRENGILGILADQRIPKRGDLCAFFGRPTSCSPLPALLAKRTDAAIIGLHCKTISNKHWELTFTKVDGRDSQACATNLEQAWRTAPSDVFWFQDRWKLPKIHPLQNFTRKPWPEKTLITRPLQFLKISSKTTEAPNFPFPEYLFNLESTSSDSISHTSNNYDLIISDTPRDLSKQIRRTAHLPDHLFPQQTRSR